MKIYHLTFSPEKPNPYIERSFEINDKDRDNAVIHDYAFGDEIKTSQLNKLIVKGNSISMYSDCEDRRSVFLRAVRATLKKKEFELAIESEKINWRLNNIDHALEVISRQKRRGRGE